MMRETIVWGVVLVAVIAAGAGLFWAAIDPGSSTSVATIPADDRTPSLIGSEIYEIGRKSAQTEIELAKRRDELEAAKAELYDLERVVYFTDCIERRSGRDYEAAFDKGTFNEECKNETNAKTPEQLSDAARAIMAKKAKP